MNKFRMKQPVYIIVMLALGAACGVFAAVINLINLIKTPSVNTQRLILLILLVALALFLLVLCAGVLVLSLIHI